MDKISGILFDGLTSKPHPVNISVSTSADIVLEHENEEEIIVPKSAVNNVEKAGDYFLILTLSMDGRTQVLEFKSKNPVFWIKMFSSKSKNLTDKVLSGGFEMVLLSLLLSGLLIFFVGYWLVPFTGETIGANVSKEMEIEIGNTYFETFTENYSIDEINTPKVNSLLLEFDFGKDYPLEVVIVNHRYANAFAFPGGRIAIFKGLIDQMNEPEELFAVLAHEVAHVNNRHQMKSIGRDIASYLIYSWVLGDVVGVTNIFFNNYHQFEKMTYSRSLEKDADLTGIETMIKNKVSPHGMVELMLTLQRLNLDNNQGKVAFSTHPPTTSRISYTSQRIKGIERTPTPIALLKIWKEVKNIEEELLEEF